MSLSSLNWGRSEASAQATLVSTVLHWSQLDFILTRTWAIYFAKPNPCLLGFFVVVGFVFLGFGVFWFFFGDVGLHCSAMEVPHTALYKLWFAQIGGNLEKVTWKVPAGLRSTAPADGLPYIPLPSLWEHTVYPEGCSYSSFPTFLLSCEICAFLLSTLVSIKDWLTNDRQTPTIANRKNKSL